MFGVSTFPFIQYFPMKVKAFLFASLFAMSLSLTACGGNTEETPATMDTNSVETAPSTQTTDTAATAPAVTPADTTAAAGTDTAAAGADTTK